MATPVEGKRDQSAHLVPVGSIDFSKTNPRKHFDQAQLEDLAKSVRQHGVLQPVLLRPHGAGRYELVAGERRIRAAKLAGLEEVLCLARDLTDAEVLEIQVIENLQRSDLHPLEEADGYRQLMAKPGYDVARIAERTGRSVKYVYDRVKLLELSKDAQKIFLDGGITAGHAILLARLTPEQQKQAMKEHGALFEGERLLWDPQASTSSQGTRKAVSVREFQGWIDKHCRFDTKAPDPMLFPEAAETLTAALEQAEKIIPITHDHYVTPEAKDGNRTWGPQSWRRADGKKDSKTCAHSVTGVIVVGYGRGEAFRVCTEKEKCSVHWAREQREKKRRQAATAAGSSTAQSSWQQEEAKRVAQRAREDAARRRWEKGATAILKAMAVAIKKAGTHASGLLAQTILDAIDDRRTIEMAEGLMPRGKTAEDLVRFAAFLALAREAGEYNAERYFAKRAKSFGVDVKKILAEAVPEARCKSCGCTEDKACDVGGRGCSWTQLPDENGLGLCSACASKSAAAKAKRKK